MTNWWFLDSCSGDKFFRIDEAQEHLYYVNDICEEEVYIAEQRESTDDAANDVMKAGTYRDDVSRVSTSSSSRQSQESGDDRETEDGKAITSQVSNVEAVDTEPMPSETSDTPAAEPESEMADIEDNEEDSEENSEDSNKLQVVSNISNKKMSISSLKIDESEMDLITAAKLGNLNKVAQLHTGGHTLDDRDHEGRTALHHAAFIGNVDVVRYLAAYAPISVLDAQDDIMYHTALHRAATRRDKVVCSILVSAGASLDLKDKQGYTAQQLAAIVGDKILAEYLESVSKSVIL